MMFARSTIRPVRAGKFRAKLAAIANSKTPTTPASNAPLPPKAEGIRPAIIVMPLCRDGSSEFHLRRFVRTFARREFRHRLVTAEERIGPYDSGECAKLGVIRTHGLDVVAARNRNAIFGAFQLRLESKEVLVGFELGIVLAHGDESAKGTAQLVLSILELLDLFRVGQLRG